jgi:DNA modification methylase
MKKDRLCRIINFRVSEQTERELAAHAAIDGTSVDNAARKLALESLHQAERQRRLNSFSVDDLGRYELFEGDAQAVLSRLPSRAFSMCLTSPPYWRQRDYGHTMQVGQERTPELYVNRLAQIFSEVFRVLRDDGTLWVNIDDSYWHKELVGIPWMLAFELKRRGWRWRSEIVWAKATTPEPVKDRPTRAHEALLLFTKSRNYFYDFDAMLEPHDNSWAIDCIRKSQEQGVNGRPRNNPFKKDDRHSKGQHGITRADYGALMNPKGKNRRDVWTINTEKFRGCHSAVMPVALAELCVKAGSRPGDCVLDPFNGVGTTGIAALGLGRRYVGAELLAKFIEVTRSRLGSQLTDAQAALRSEA